MSFTSIDTESAKAQMYRINGMHKPGHIVDSAGSDHERQRSGRRRNTYVSEAAFPTDQCLALVVSWNDPASPLPHV